MPQSFLLGLMLFFVGLQPQFPPPTSAAPPHPAEERRMPVDEPQVVKPASKHRHVDRAQLLRQANELANLADDIPSSVDRATKGLLPQDLNLRLKRIEKLSKQLRQELTQ